MDTALAIALVLVGGVLTLRFRQVSSWYDRALRTLADGPGAPEPERRSVAGQWLMIGTGSSTAAKWYRSAATLLTGVSLLVAGVATLAGA